MGIMPRSFRATDETNSLAFLDRYLTLQLAHRSTRSLGPAHLPLSRRNIALFYRRFGNSIRVCRELYQAQSLPLVLRGWIL